MKPEKFSMILYGTKISNKNAVNNEISGIFSILTEVLKGFSKQGIFQRLPLFCNIKYKNFDFLL